MGNVTSLEERLRIIELARFGLTDKQIAAHVGWSLATVRKWRRRGQRAGRPAVGSTMGRPKVGALSSFSVAMRETVRQWRIAHPGWGPKTLHTELALHPAFAGQPIPSPASIGRLLQETGLSRRYDRHADLPRTVRAAAKAAHELWEIDARGHEYVPDVGVISLIDVNDRYSHARLLSYPCLVGRTRWQRHPNTEDYQTVLRLAFTDWGLPERVQVDRSSVFVDNTSKSPFPSRIHLWLLALGVTLSLGRPHQPRDQAMTERSHELWFNQSLRGQRYASWEVLYLALRDRRDFLNTALPCATLDNQPPLQAFPEARHSLRLYRPEWEFDMLDLDRVFAYLAEGRWFRLVSKDGNISLGTYIYHVGLPYKHQQLEITFDPSDHHLVCQDESGAVIRRLPVKGISREPLMGNMALAVTLPLFQLALPFDWDAQQVVRLFEIIPGMT